MKLAVIAYLPPNDPRFHTQAFIENLRENPVRNDLILFTDGELVRQKASELFKKADVLLISPPDKILTNTHSRPFNISNILFLTALKIVGVKLKARGYTHFLYLESDCRVRGTHWDDLIWTEFQTLPGETSPLVAGSLVVYNPARSGEEGMVRFDTLRASNTKSNFPVSAFRSSTDIDPCIMAMGAGAIYDIEAMLNLFAPFKDTLHLAQKFCAFDLEVGKRIWKTHGPRSYDRVRKLETIYSGHGDRVTTLEERKELLLSGKVCLVHQVKTGWKP